MIGSLKPEDYGIAISAYVLGKISPEKMPQVAAAALETGKNGPSILQLAALKNPTYFEVQQWFPGFLSDLGMEGLDKEQASLMIGRFWSTRVANGELDPGEGLRKLANLFYGGDYNSIFAEFREPEELLIIDDPQKEKEFREAIVFAAQDFLKGNRKYLYFEPPNYDPKIRIKVNIRKPYSFPVVRVLTTWIAKLYFHHQVHGAENIPSAGPFVVVANHASFLDPYFIGYSSIHRQVGFMAKEELFRIPVFGRLIRGWGAFPVKRGGRDMAAVQQFHDFLHSGKPLVLFAEGTRTLTGELQPAKKGAGMLLYNARVPVIPAYIDGTFKSWPKGKLFPRPCPTSTTYGPAIPMEDLYREKPEKSTYARIAQRLMEHIAALRPLRNP